MLSIFLVSTSAHASGEIAKARNAIAAKKFPKAETEIAKILKLNPRNPEAHYLKALIYAERKEKISAEAEIRLIRRLDSKNKIVSQSQIALLRKKLNIADNKAYKKRNAAKVAVLRDGKILQRKSVKEDIHRTTTVQSKLGKQNTLLSEKDSSTNVKDDMPVVANESIDFVTPKLIEVKQGQRGKSSIPWVLVGFPILGFLYYQLRVRNRKKKMDAPKEERVIPNVMELIEGCKKYRRMNDLQADLVEKIIKAEFSLIGIQKKLIAYPGHLISSDDVAKLIEAKMLLESIHAKAAMKKNENRKLAAVTKIKCIQGFVRSSFEVKPKSGNQYPKIEPTFDVRECSHG